MPSDTSDYRGLRLVSDPFERGAMRVSPSDGGAVHRQEEAARWPGRSGARGDGRQYPRELVRYPVRTEVDDLLREPLSHLRERDYIAACTKPTKNKHVNKSTKY